MKQKWLQLNREVALKQIFYKESRGIDQYLSKVKHKWNWTVKRVKAENGMCNT